MFAARNLCAVPDITTLHLRHLLFRDKVLHRVGKQLAYSFTAIARNLGTIESSITAGASQAETCIAGITR